MTCSYEIVCNPGHIRFNINNWHKKFKVIEHNLVKHENELVFWVLGIQYWVVRSTARIIEVFRTVTKGRL